ncbi:MAG: four helix bundle protein [Saprospiraceae bacterium]
MRDFRKLEIWHLGMELVKLTYQLVKKLPSEEQFGLSFQMRKAAISMPSNIAEGCSRTSNKDASRFFEISIGSAFELETQILAGFSIGHFSKEDTDFILPLLQTFQRKTNSYRNTMN